MLQKAMCISKPMSGRIKVGDYCMINIDNKYVDNDGITYVEVYTSNGQEIGDMPLNHFSLVNDHSITLLKDSTIDFEELSRRYGNKERATVTFESTTVKQPMKYDVRFLTEERINEMLAATKF